MPYIRAETRKQRKKTKKKKTPFSVTCLVYKISVSQSPKMFCCPHPSDIQLIVRGERKLENTHIQEAEIRQ